MANNTGKKTGKEIDKQEERMRILSKADQNKYEVINIFGDGSLVVSKEIESLSIDYNSKDDPEEKFEIFYKGIQRTLKKHLPKGSQYKEARSYIYEEKKVYMTRGKRINEKGIRGADSRMGYISDAKEMMKMITDWVLKGGTMVELHNTLREANIKKGYGARVNY